MRPRRGLWRHLDGERGQHAIRGHLSAADVRRSRRAKCKSWIWWSAGTRIRKSAEALGIRTGTVKIHLKHIFEKTGIRGRYGLALSGLKHKGLLAAVLV